MAESKLVKSLVNLGAAEACGTSQLKTCLTRPYRAEGDPCDHKDVELEVIDAYDRYARSLFSYIVMLCKNVDLAQDIVQEVYLRYYIALTRREKIHKDKAWLFRVARNYLLDRLKDYAVKNCVSIGDAEVSRKLDCRSNPESEYEPAEILHLALGLLSTRERECVQLRAEGLSYHEIALILNLRPGTVGTLLARGLKKITDLPSNNETAADSPRF